MKSPLKIKLPKSFSRSKKYSTKAAPTENGNKVEEQAEPVEVEKEAVDSDVQEEVSKTGEIPQGDASNAAPVEDTNVEEGLQAHATEENRSDAPVPEASNGPDEIAPQEIVEEPEVATTEEDGAKKPGKIRKMLSDTFASIKRRTSKKGKKENPDNKAQETSSKPKADSEKKVKEAQETNQEVETAAECETETAEQESSDSPKVEQDTSISSENNLTKKSETETEIETKIEEAQETNQEVATATVCKTVIAEQKSSDTPEVEQDTSPSQEKNLTEKTETETEKKVEGQETNQEVATVAVCETVIAEQGSCDTPEVEQDASTSQVKHLTEKTETETDLPIEIKRKEEKLAEELDGSKAKKDDSEIEETKEKTATEEPTEGTIKNIIVKKYNYVRMGKNRGGSKKPANTFSVCGFICEAPSRYEKLGGRKKFENEKFFSTF